MAATTTERPRLKQRYDAEIRQQLKESLGLGSEGRMNQPRDFFSAVAALTAGRSTYGAYCTPKGRVLATFLLWRSEQGFFMQLPASLREQANGRLLATAKQVTTLHRHFDQDGDRLSYTIDMAAVGQPLQHHLAADLRRSG